MATMNPQLEMTEVDLEAMEPIALSDPPQVDSQTRVDINDKPELETNFLGKDKKIILFGLWENLSKIIRVVVNYSWLQYCCGNHTESTRAYQIWPGNNVFFFRGRLICGPDPRGLLLTAVSISLSSWIFAVYIANDLSNHSGLIITFSMILTIMVLVNLVMVSMTDPGIIPRNDQPSSEEGDTSNVSTRKKRVNVNNVAIRIKFCRICKIYRPPRSCHCAICDNCVEKFDHHCPWIGQCIGLRNYRFYLTFLITTLALFIYLFAFSCKRIHQRMLKTGKGLFGMLVNFPETLALLLFSFAAIGFLGGLGCYHLYLIAINQTAYENFRQRYVGSRNPYDKGVIGNIREVILVPLPPSKVDFRAEVPNGSQCHTK